VSRTEKTAGGQPKKNIFWWMLFGFGLGIFLPLLIVFLILRNGVENITIFPDREQMAQEEYERLIDEMEMAVYINPDAVQSIMETRLIGITDPLAVAEGYAVLAEAEWMLGNYETAIDHNRTIINTLSPARDEQHETVKLSHIYLGLVTASIGSDQYNSAEAVYREMRSVLIPLLEEERDPVKISEVYLNLLTAAYEIGYFDLEKDYQDLQDAVYPALIDEENPLRIARIYHALIEGALISYDMLSVESYSQELIDRLGHQRDEIKDASETLEVNNYLAAAEINLGHFQFAIIYLNDVVEVNPSPTNLYWLATIYNLAGDHGCSYKWYTRLIQHESDAKHPIYLETAEEAVEYLEEICENCGEHSCPN
jgi:tetratricopeptide (TPR) repeat protein